MAIKDTLYDIYSRARDQIEDEPAEDETMDTITRDAAAVVLDGVWEELKALAEEIEGDHLYKVVCYQRSGELHHEELCCSLYKAKESKKQWARLHKETTFCPTIWVKNPNGQWKMVS